jgi:CubicO group peptidase (beta-lactamase class C family)
MSAFNELVSAIPSAKQAGLQTILERLIDNKKVFGTSFAMMRNDQIWKGAAGNLKIDDPFFIASTTKLFTTALILCLKSQGELSLEDPISKYLDPSILKGLHTFKGKEYSTELTIQQLLAHTSGLPDYFQNKGYNGKSLEDEIIAGKDRAWFFEETIEITKSIKPLFIPGTPGKAHYSDSNFQLLGKIIEIVSGKSYANYCDEVIIKPLGLSQTYVYQDPNDQNPKCLYFKEKPLPIPLAMSSFGPDGGIVSTSTELLIFLEAFFEGKLFPERYISELKQWNRIFFPMRSGIGIHKFKLPCLFNPTRAIPSFIGHSGLSGALAFYSPRENLYITGTVNQVAHPDLSFKIMIKLTQQFLKK